MENLSHLQYDRPLTITKEKEREKKEIYRKEEGPAKQDRISTSSRKINSTDKSIRECTSESKKKKTR